MSERFLFGRWTSGKRPLSAQDAAAICRRAASRRQAMARYPEDKVLRLLARLRRRWLDPRYPLRREVARRLPEETGFSPAMVAKGLEELCWTFDPELLRKKLDTELRAVPRNEGFHHDPATGTSLRWHPVGTVLHVLAGNVFVGAAGSLVEGLLTGNVNILKMSSAERVFLPALIRSLVEEDEDRVVASSLAVVEYPSSASDVVGEFKRRVDAIVVWGGEEAVRGYRDGLPARSRLVVFGPKLSLAVVTREGLEASGVETVAEALAREVSIWDQNACTAPQACYVEGEARARELCEALAWALGRRARELPPGQVPPDNAVEIRKLRGVFEVAEGRGAGGLWESRRGLEWTVLFDRDAELSPSPLHRTLRVIALRRWEDALDALEPLRGYVQTVGLACSPEEFAALADRLGEAGAQRVVGLGGMCGGEIDDPHDGQFDLPQLLQLVVRRRRASHDGEGPAGDVHPVDALPEEARRALVDARLRRLIDEARRSPFYARRLAGLRVDGAHDLPRLPVLTREEMEAGVPPAGTALGTRPYAGGYVSRSGGSTGEPKYSIYDGKDWEALIGEAVRVFRALGLKPGDRVANCMLAGDLYGSFVSFDHINARLGVTSFALANSAKPAVLVDLWRRLGLNAIEGLPSAMMPLLRKAKELEPRFTLDTVVYAGMPLSEADRRWLRKDMGAGRVASVIGANDGGQFAYQCPRQSGALHHVIDDFNYLEVVDERGRPLPDGRPGRLLITSLLKTAFPLIRYAIGDAGRIVRGRCGCARTSRVLEYLGRADDMLPVGLMNLRHGDARRALEGLPVSELQIAARSEAAGERLVFRLESAEASPALAKRAERALLTRVAKLGQEVAEGHVLLEVEALRPGALARNPRSGKIRLLVDERTPANGARLGG